jgi:hypothetical protein
MLRKKAPSEWVTPFASLLDFAGPAARRTVAAGVRENGGDEMRQAAGRLLRLVAAVALLAGCGHPDCVSVPIYLTGPSSVLMRVSSLVATGACMPEPNQLVPECDSPFTHGMCAWAVDPSAAGTCHIVVTWDDGESFSKDVQVNGCRCGGVFDGYDTICAEVNTVPLVGPDGGAPDLVMNEGPDGGAVDLAIAAGPDGGLSDAATGQ